MELQNIINSIRKGINESDFKYNTFDRNDFLGFTWQDDSYLLIRREKEQKFKKLDYCYRADRYKVYDLERLFEVNKKVFAKITFTGKAWMFTGGIQMKVAKNNALKIIPDLVEIAENGKITKKYIQDNLLELCYLIENYNTEDLELLIEKYKLNEELKNF